MTHNGAHREPPAPLPGAETPDDDSLRARWEATQESLRVRFDEPIERATRLTKRTLAWFPVRVWRHFLQHNGFLLAAGVSYQALFAIFAALYVAFAVVGIWLGGSPQAIDGMIALINRYVPGLISVSGHGGLVSAADVEAVATGNAGVLGVTGAIALIAVIWTAIGWVTFSRRAVRDIFGLPLDRRGYVLLKARDFLAALVFGIALVAGGVLSAVATWALDWIFSLLGWSTASGWSFVAARLISVAVSFALDAAALAALFRFLSGASLAWRTIIPGALLGGGAITVLQLGAGFLLGYTPSNPLLATFAVFIGLLLWFRLVGIVTLVASAWIAVAAQDQNLPLQHLTEAELRVTEHKALLLTAQVRLRTARDERANAPWYRAWRADRAVHAAEAELARIEASPPPPVRTSILD